MSLTILYPKAQKIPDIPTWKKHFREMSCNTPIKTLKYKILYSSGLRSLVPLNISLVLPCPALLCCVNHTSVRFLWRNVIRTRQNTAEARARISKSNERVLWTLYDTQFLVFNSFCCYDTVSCCPRWVKPECSLSWITELLCFVVVVPLLTRRKDNSLHLRLSLRHCRVIKRQFETFKH